MNITRDQQTIFQGHQIPQNRPSSNKTMDNQYISRDVFLVFVRELTDAMQTIVNGLKYLNNNQVETVKGIEAMNRNVTSIHDMLSNMPEFTDKVQHNEQAESENQTETSEDIDESVVKLIEFLDSLNNKIK